MSIYLSHTSARATWGLIGAKGLSASTLCDVRRPTDVDTTLREIKQTGYFESGFLSHIKQPIDLLFPSKKSRIRSLRISPHLCLRDLPVGSFRKLRDNVYVVSPPMNFVQMGEFLSTAHLVSYGLELCGQYSLAPGTKRGFVDRIPLTDVDELLSFTKQGQRLKGVQSAREALEWVRPGSRSPRETLLFVLVVLPSEMGGYGLPLPTLNETVTLSAAAARIAGRTVLHPDLCWRAFNVIVEYDSDATHMDEKQVIRDVDRKDAFARDGWHVITVTKDRLNKPNKLDRLIRDDLAPLLGVSAPAKTKEFVAARSALRDELFEFDPYVPLVVRNRGQLPSS